MTVVVSPWGSVSSIRRTNDVTRGETKNQISNPINFQQPTCSSVLPQTHLAIDSIFPFHLSIQSFIPTLPRHPYRLWTSRHRPLGSRQPYNFASALQLWSIAWLMRAGPAFPPA
ncbi:hypothetical protein GB937_003959 [Aspergillus fischeri]|nr:hypothetical protein GB937_003959 [Aspergillus fischeri]